MTYSHKTFSIYIYWNPENHFLNINSSNEKKLELFKQAYFRDIFLIKKLLNCHTLEAIHFGGKSVAYMPNNLLISLIKELKKNFVKKNNLEISVELEINHINKKILNFLKLSEVTRLSLGPFLFENKKVEASLCDLLKKINFCTDHFKNISLDLFYKRRNLNVKRFFKVLDKISKSNITHLSTYENDGNFKKSIISKNILSREEFLKECNRILIKEKFKQYEVCNYAKINYISKYYESLYALKSFAAIGPGAHSRIINNKSVTKLKNVKNLNSWKNSYKSFKKRRLIKKQNITEEILLQCIRSSSGINTKDFSNIFGFDIYDVVDIKKKELLIKENLLYKRKDFIRLTPKGMTLVNNVVNYLLS